VTTVLVGGALANRHFNGGGAWVRLSWVLGLERLGCRVFFVEQIDPATCVDADGNRASFEDSANKRYFDEVVEDFGLADSSALVCGEGAATSGLAFAEVIEIARESDLLVNVSGHLTLEEVVSRPRRRAYIDLDPGFTQFWHVSGDPGARLEGHDSYFTVGANIGTARCDIPTGGIDWRPLAPPVLLAEWPATGGGGASEPFTTVGSWRGPFGPIEHEGRTLGLKAHEFRKVIELPKLTGLRFELAIDIHPADAKDRDALVANGWQLVDPRQTVPRPEDYRRYVQASGAEFSVAQGIYVDTSSGWLSDRTVEYLASGKPALVQDTGFSRNYPVGEGLVPFQTVEEAAAGAARIGGDYASHSATARAIAEEYFDSDKVLGSFLDQSLG
jgi:hypothetical protein